MQVELPEELQAVRQATREFARRELEPIAEAIERTGDYPPETFPLLARNGYLAMRLPERFGGGDLGLFAFCLVNEEFCRSHYAFLYVLGHSSVTAMMLVRHGTAEQQQRVLPGIGEGKLRAAFALTEPGAGSDAAAIQTRAVPQQGGWLLNGRKHFISGGAEADFVLVIAVTDPEKRARGGITAFLVERGTPGLSVSRVETVLGPRGVKLAELCLDNCRVPDGAVVGKVGEGFRIVVQSLTEGRMRIACGCIGVADRMLEMSIDHARVRHTFGKPLAERQAIQWMIADSAVELTTARAMAYEILRQVDAGKDVGTGPAMCKLYCSEMAGRVADRAVQIHGGMGVIQGFPVERFYRDVRHARIGEGASEIMRMVISRDLLKD